MKSARLLVLLLVLGCGGIYMVQHAFTSTPAAPAASSTEQFPLLSRFEQPHSYGYFIGDEIPLTLVIETTGNVTLDLINLPHPGDKVGPFEIRHLQLTSAVLSPGSKVYRAAYTLQYFGPTPMTTIFGPLEILYAVPPAPNLPQSAYTYKRLLTQPALIHLSRLGPLRPPRPLAIKGQVDDSRTGLMWLFLTGGTLLVLGAAGGLGWEQWTAWQRQRARAAHPSTITALTLQTLRHEATMLFRTPEEYASSIGARLDHLLREYVQTAYGVPAFTLTTSELAGQLHGTPQAHHMLSLLEQCEALKHQPHRAPLAVERELWWDTIMLFEKLQGEPQR
jgi:hypothetical protein